MSGSAVAKPSAASSATAPRKRRKRTTAGGAADDCFACANSRVKCDRRRPYCSQCLERGKDCSGYKTTLTWGVGVASRGKLRGRSLPVSDGQSTAATTTRTVPLPTERRQSTFKPVVHHHSGEKSPDQCHPVLVASILEAESFPHTVSQEWPATTQHPELQAASYAAPPDQNPVFGTNTPAVTLQFPVDTLPVSHAPRPSTYSYLQATSSGVAEPTSEAWVPPLDILHATAYGVDTDHIQTLPLQWPPPNTTKRPVSPEEDPEIEEVYSAPVYSSSQPSVTVYRPEHTPWNFNQSPFANSLPDLLLEQSVGRTPRIRYLISYFAEVIAPVIVAFDSPTNPYRTRILQLAHHSDTLQHAIAALSASNIRQRREEKILSTERTEPARMSSMAHRALTDTSFQERYGIKDIGGDNHEEIFHKSVAIRSLNAQLADQSQRHHDSVLATLLVLCLFHICETGVAQFQTQFAGVRKLLAMRRRTNVFESEEAKWCTRMFTWFDAMTATINNREGQLQGPFLDMTCLSDEEWALENLAGCDGRLFKIIARLGRLNVLAQNQPVDRSYDIDTPAAMPGLPQAISHYTPNGMNAAYAANLYANPQVHTENSEFWTEWHSLRQQLEAWHLDTTSLAHGYDVSTLSPSHSCGSLSSSSTSTQTFHSLPMSPGSNPLVAPKNLIDLSNISEAFRYSALLYTERLAYPDLPSTHPRIQTFVLTAMHYIAAVHSDVYLLWPLFITGSECVYVEHRTAIRNRCKDIQKDSGFYNNISCLSLLEKIWAKNPAVEAPNQILYNGFTGLPGNPVSNVRAQSYNTGISSAESGVRHDRGFKWQSIIENEGLDGEYIVV